GDTMFAEQARASGKSEVLKALDKSASAVRTRLGESISSVQKFLAPLEEVTTSSLEGLKAYTLGRRALESDGYRAPIPYFQRALELDPNSASAYASLSSTYANLH